jgi:hypothetical protein
MASTTIPALTASQAATVDHARALLAAEHGYDTTSLAYRAGQLEFHLAELLALVGQGTQIMAAITTQLTPAQQQDAALCAKALEDTKAVPADRCQLALSEVRVALEISLRVIGQLADGTS